MIKTLKRKILYEKVITLISSAAGIYMIISLILSYTGRMTKGYPDSLFVSNIVPKIVSEITHSSSNRFDDVWEKDPNDWTDAEKDYVDGFFEWLDDDK